LTAGLEQGDTAIVSGAVDFFTRRGDRGSKPVLVQVLSSTDDVNMARSLLNSDEPDL
jgi:hypothetical protein